MTKNNKSTKNVQFNKKQEKDDIEDSYFIKRQALMEKYDKTPIKENTNVLNSLKIVMVDFSREYILLTCKQSYIFTDLNIIFNAVSIFSALFTILISNIYKFDDIKGYLPGLCSIYFGFCYFMKFFEYFFRNDLIFSGKNPLIKKGSGNSIKVYIKRHPKVEYKFLLEIYQSNLVNKEVCDVTELFYEDGVFDHHAFTEILDRALSFNKNE